MLLTTRAQFKEYPKSCQYSEEIDWYMSRSPSMSLLIILLVLSCKSHEIELQETGRSRRNVALAIVSRNNLAIFPPNKSIPSSANIYMFWCITAGVIHQLSKMSSFYIAKLVNLVHFLSIFLTFSAISYFDKDKDVT